MVVRAAGRPARRERPTRPPGRASARLERPSRGPPLRFPPPGLLLGQTEKATPGSIEKEMLQRWLHYQEILNVVIVSALLVPGSMKASDGGIVQFR